MAERVAKLEVLGFDWAVPLSGGGSQVGRRKRKASVQRESAEKPSKKSRGGGMCVSCHVVRAAKTVPGQDGRLCAKCAGAETELQKRASLGWASACGPNE